MSCLFTLIFSQEGVTQHPGLLWQDGTDEPEPAGLAGGDSATTASGPGSREAMCAHPAPLWLQRGSPLTAHCMQCAYTYPPHPPKKTKKQKRITVLETHVLYRYGYNHTQQDVGLEFWQIKAQRSQGSGCEGSVKCCKGKARCTVKKTQ